MSPLEQELGRLCSACGSCCRGVMFGVVELEEGEEPAPEVRRRLDIVDGKFPQPCAAHDGASCTIYDARPRACRNYTCALYKRHAAGEGGGIAEKIALVTRIRSLVGSVCEGEPAHVGSILGVVAPIVGDRARWRDRPDKLLDVAELAMRLKRDLGWRPPE